MRRSARLCRLVIGAMLAVGPAWADGSGSVASDVEDPAVVAKFRKLAEDKTKCSPIEEVDKKYAAYEAASGDKWDRAGMDCAVQYGTEAVLTMSVPSSALWALVTFRAGHIEKTLKVLGSNIEYFDVLAKSYEDFYQTIEVQSELTLRWERTRERSERLLARVEPLAGSVPEVRVLRAAYYLASTLKEATPDKKTKAIAAALKDLEAVVKDSPKTLDGLPQFLLGQTLDALPEFLGGDSDRAVSLLEQAHKMDPDNLAFDHALADAYLGERRTDEAAKLFEAALSVVPDRGNPQDYVDEAKYMGGLAVRISRPDLAKKFAEKREAVLAAKPFLLARKGTAAFGHTSENPMTGVDSNALR